MRRAIVILAWTMAFAGIGLMLGASFFGLAGAFLADPGARPASWTGWNILFFAFVVGLPCALATLGLLLGGTGRLPGTRRT